MSRAEQYTRASTEAVRKLYYEANRAGIDKDLLNAKCQALMGKENPYQLTISECSRLIDIVMGKKERYIRRDNRPIDRASQSQINILLGMARGIGWSRDQLEGLVARVTKVERMEWCTPAQLSMATTALTEMIEGGRVGDRKERT